MTTINRIRILATAPFRLVAAVFVGAVYGIGLLLQGAVEEIKTKWRDA